MHGIDAITGDGSNDPMTKQSGPSLDHLDAESRRQAEQAQAAMRELIALVPRHFTYADELDLVFLPDHEG
jgi:hypothetical protein